MKTPIASAFARAALLLILAPLSALRAQAAPAAVKLANLQGTILDTLGRPVAKAIIEIEDPALAAFADDSGFFRLRNIPAGPRVVRVRKIGFEGVDFELALIGDSTVHIGVKLYPLAQQLEAVTILTKEEEQHPRLAATGFYTQKRAGFGTMLTPEEIEKKKETANEASDIFRDLVGVTLGRSRFGGANLLGKASNGGVSLGRNSGGQSGPCMLNIIKDGMLVKQAPGETFDMIVSKDEIYAVEVYPRAEYTPAAYHQVNGNDFCGTVVIWTHSRMDLKAPPATER